MQACAFPMQKGGGELAAPWLWQQGWLLDNEVEHSLGKIFCKIPEPAWSSDAHRFRAFSNLIAASMVVTCTCAWVHTHTHTSCMCISDIQGWEWPCGALALPAARPGSKSPGMGPNASSLLLIRPQGLFHAKNF